MFHLRRGPIIKSMGAKKAAFLVIAGICFAACAFVVVSAGIFFWKQIKGVLPAFSRPPQDIAKIIEEKHDLQSIPPDFPLKLPEGFSISVFAKNLGKPRAMLFDPNGVMLLSIPASGKVVALLDKDKDGLADEERIILENLDRPHGLEILCQDGACKLYVAQSSEVSLYDYDTAQMRASNYKKITGLPSGSGHFTRTIKIITENQSKKILISVGSSCNVCHESDWRRAKILVADLDGSNLKEYAKGLRNSVFMTTHPVTGEVWATEMGRDRLGDDLPPDEINIIKEGKNYGWPICYGKNTHDTDFDKNTYFRNPCLEPFEVPSLIDIPAHSAPLGLVFVPQNSNWPKDYVNNLIIAYHGSWNRSVPTGYKIVRFKIDEKGSIIDPKSEDFISGFLQGNRSLGRPVDIIFDAGGNMFITDDSAGTVYRINYKPQ